MRDQTLPLETRIAAAREALPFFHSKLQDQSLAKRLLVDMGMLSVAAMAAGPT